MQCLSTSDSGFWGRSPSIFGIITVTVEQWKSMDRFPHFHTVTGVLERLIELICGSGCQHNRGLRVCRKTRVCYVNGVDFGDNKQYYVTQEEIYSCLHSRFTYFGFGSRQIRCFRISPPTDHISDAVAIILKNQPWVGESEKLSVLSDRLVLPDMI